MTSPSGGTATARARKLREALIRINALRELEPLARTVSKLALEADDAALEAIIDGFTQPADHPSTVYGVGDTVDVRVTGQVIEHGLCVGARIVLTTLELEYAASEGRVRLVQAAAPTYEPGVYQDHHGELFVYSLNGAPDPSTPFFDVAAGAWCSAKDLHDLTLCDPVPREAT